MHGGKNGEYGGRATPYFRRATTLPMKKLITPLLAVVSAFALNAQSLTNVTINPANPTECTFINLHILGTLPTNGEPQSAPLTVVGNTLNIQFNTTGSGGGNAPFNQSVPALGPYAAGNYTLIVIMYFNGNPVDTVVRNFTVAPGFNPDAGGYNDTTVCTSAPNFPLISVLLGNPTPGGDWFDPNGDPVNNGIFNAGSMPEGFYTYSFDLLAPCISTAQSILISYYPYNDPGLDTTIHVCSQGGAPVDLFTRLGGNPMTGGTWTRNGVAHSNIFQPGTDPCGQYVYTLDGIGACGPSTATVNVVCDPAPNAGNNGSVTLCATDTTENLNTHINGEAPNGYWVAPDGFVAGGFNQGVNVSFFGAGLYGYVIPGTTCPNDTAFLTVTLVESGGPCAIGIEEVAPGITQLELSPNPARGQAWLDLELSRNITCTMDLLDISGKLLRNTTLRSNGRSIHQPIDLNGLGEGVYLVRVNTPEGSTVRRLMVR